MPDILQAQPAQSEAQKAAEMLAREQKLQPYLLAALQQTNGLGIMALKSVILLNGAAAIALLALVGRVWGDQAVAIHLVEATRQFVIGTFAGGIASALGYFYSLCFDIALGRIIPHGKGRTETMLFRIGYVLMALMIICAVYGFISFGIGAAEASHALSAPRGLTAVQSERPGIRMETMVAWKWHDIINYTISGIGAASGIWAYLATRRERRLRQPAVRWRRARYGTDILIQGEIVAEHGAADFQIVEVRAPKGTVLHEPKMDYSTMGDVNGISSGKCYGKRWFGNRPGISLLITGVDMETSFRIVSTVADKARGGARSTFTAEV
ncbi:MAG: hypothetical protein M0006_05325 [Magnetospirillum sp.]|nr:hypothetical protein [Magnetospirillum sp.]